jgi:hypothetical protein
MHNYNSVDKWRHANYAATYGTITGKHNGDVRGVISPVGKKVTHSSTFKIPTAPSTPPVQIIKATRIHIRNPDSQRNLHRRYHSY